MRLSRCCTQQCNRDCFVSGKVERERSVLPAPEWDGVRLSLGMQFIASWLLIPSERLPPLQHILRLQTAYLTWFPVIDEKAALALVIVPRYRVAYLNEMSLNTDGWCQHFWRELGGLSSYIYTEALAPIRHMATRDQILPRRLSKNNKKFAVSITSRKFVGCQRNFSSAALVQDLSWILRGKKHATRRV